MTERKGLEAIKEALLCISGVLVGCEECPYVNEKDCMGAAAADALEYIEQHEAKAGDSVGSGV